jgi:hypothetical protein
MEALQRLHNRGSISTGYDIDNSLKFEEDNSETIVTTNQAAGDRKTWTFSAWVKRTELTYDYATIFGAEYTIIKFLGDDRLGLELYNGTYYSLITTQKFRDTSAWYHIVAVCDTTQATASERSRLYVNGERVTVFDTSNSPPLNSEFAIGQAGSAGSGAWLRLGQFFAGSDYFNGYMAEVHYLNGTAAQASDFGEYDSNSGIWIPKEYTGGGYGTQGFYYKFDNASNLGEDSSGEGHDANTINNITSADQATDTPTNNFCTLNMLNRTNGNSKNQEGATKVTTDGGSDWCTMMGTMGVTRGKWYWEYFKTTTGGANIFFGIAASDDPYIPYNSAAQYYIGNVATGSSIGFQVNNNSIANGNSSNVFALLSGEVLRVALDMDNGALYFGKSSSTWANSGDPTSGASRTGASTLWSSFDNKIVLPGISVYQGGDAKSNFGGYASYTISTPASDENGYGTFEYAPPSGYYALCTKNLEEFG